MIWFKLECLRGSITKDTTPILWLNLQDQKKKTIQAQVGDQKISLQRLGFGVTGLEYMDLD